TERAIVTEIPGTTRDAIEAQAVIEGFPFRLVDTAGLRDAGERVERLGIEVSKKYLAAADLVLYCEERDDPSRAAFLAEVSAPVVIAKTKADVSGEGVSIITGQGLPERLRQLHVTRRQAARAVRPQFHPDLAPAHREIGMMVRRLRQKADRVHEHQGGRPAVGLVLAHDGPVFEPPAW